MTLARVIIAALGLLLGVSAAAAQMSSSGDSGSSGSLEYCRWELSLAEQHLPRLNAEREILENSVQVLDTIEYGELRSSPGLILHALLRQKERVKQIKIDIVAFEGYISLLLRKCDQLAAEVASLPTQKPTEKILSITRDVRAAVNRVKRAFARAEQIIAASKRELAEIERRYPGITLGQRWRGPRIEVGAFLGWPISLNDPNLDPFNQRLKRGTGLSGGGEIVLAWPLADRFDLRLGGTIFHAASNAERIDNILVPGSLSVTGHYDTTALLGMIGLGFRPIDRWYVALDGGLGAGFNDLLIRNANTGATIVSNRETVTAGMVRGALTYALTDQLRIGGFLSHVRTGSMNAQVTGGGAFTMGGIRNTTVGVMLIVTPRIFLTDYD